MLKISNKQKKNVFFYQPTVPDKQAKNTTEQNLP